MNKLFVILICFSVFALNNTSALAVTDSAFKAYFRANKGVACLVPLDKWVSYGIDQVGRPCGQFVISEQDMENILAAAKRKAGDGSYDVDYLDSALALSFTGTDLLHFYVNPDKADKLHLRIPDTTIIKKGDSCGINKDFIPGGKLKSGIQEGFMDQIPFSMLGDIPGDTTNKKRYEVIHLKPKTTSGRESTPTQQCNKCYNELGQFMIWFVCILVAIVFIWLCVQYKWLNGALSENDRIDSPNVTLIKQQLDSARAGVIAAGAAATQTQKTDVESYERELKEALKGDNSSSYRPSASRFIAFLSGLLLMFVALATTCFYVYYYLCTGSAPDLTKLSGVLIALGFGMAPYAVNKITSSSDKDKTI